MTITRRLDRLADHWPAPEVVLATRLVAEVRAAAPRNLEDSAALYHRCRGLIAAPRLSEAATGRALAEAMIAVGFPAEGVRQCIADTPAFYVLAFACLGVSNWPRGTTRQRRRDAGLTNTSTRYSQTPSACGWPNWRNASR